MMNRPKLLRIPRLTAGGLITSYYCTSRCRHCLYACKKVYPHRSLEAVCADSRGGCRELLDTRHFHLDLFGNYIPGLCAGLAIRAEDLGGPLDAADYPLLTTLFSRRVEGLLDYAATRHGFQPAASYISKCHLCLEIRSFLVSRQQEHPPELQPLGFYENLEN